MLFSPLLFVTICFFFFFFRAGCGRIAFRHRFTGYAEEGVPPKICRLFLAFSVPSGALFPLGWLCSPCRVFPLVFGWACLPAIGRHPSNRPGPFRRRPELV